MITGPVNRFDCPRKLATNAVRGSSYSFFGSAELFDLALVHHGDGVGHRHGLLLVVRHVQEGEADFVLDVFKLDLHLAAQFEVEGAERLVEQQHRGSIDDGASQGDALLLTAGELDRASSCQVIELHESQTFTCHGQGVLDTLTSKPKRDIVENRHVRKERIALEHRVHRSLVRLGGGDIPPADQDATFGGLLKAGNEPQRRGFSTPRGTEQREERARRNREVEPFERREPGEPFGDSDEFEVSAAARSRTCRNIAGTGRRVSSRLRSPGGDRDDHKTDRREHGNHGRHSDP